MQERLDGLQGMGKLCRVGRTCVSRIVPRAGLVVPTMPADRYIPSYLLHRGISLPQRDNIPPSRNVPDCRNRGWIKMPEFLQRGTGKYPPQQCSAEKVGSKSRQSGAWTSKKKIRDGRGVAKRQIRGVPHSCFPDFLAAAVAAASEPPARRTGKGAMISSHECMVLLPQNHNVPMQKNLRCFPSADWGLRRRMFFPDSLVTRIRRRRSSAIRRNGN